MGNRDPLNSVNSGRNVFNGNLIYNNEVLNVLNFNSIVRRIPDPLVGRPATYSGILA